MSLTEFLLVILYLTLGIGVPLIVVFFGAAKLIRKVLEGARNLGRGRLMLQAEKTLAKWDADAAHQAVFNTERPESERHSALRYLILVLPDEALGQLLESVFELDSQHLVISAVKTIGQREMRAAESKIVSLLENHSSLQVKNAAAEALGYIGSLTTIPLLTKFERSLPRMASKSAPKEAVKRIQARVMGAPDEGALSVVDGREEGTLAISSGATRGSLSPTD